MHEGLGYKAHLDLEEGIGDTPHIMLGCMPRHEQRAQDLAQLWHVLPVRDDGIRVHAADVEHEHAAGEEHAVVAVCQQGRRQGLEGLYRVRHLLCYSAGCKICCM